MSIPHVLLWGNIKKICVPLSFSGLVDKSEVFKSLEYPIGGRASLGKWRVCAQSVHCATFTVGKRNIEHQLENDGPFKPQPQPINIKFGDNFKSTYRPGLPFSGKVNKTWSMFHVLVGTSLVVIVYFTTFTTEDFKTAAGDNLKCFLLCVCTTYKCITTTTSKGLRFHEKCGRSFWKDL